MQLIFVGKLPKLARAPPSPKSELLIPASPSPPTHSPIRLPLCPHGWLSGHFLLPTPLPSLHHHSHHPSLPHLSLHPSLPQLSLHPSLPPLSLHPSLSPHISPFIPLSHILSPPSSFPPPFLLLHYKTHSILF